MWVGQGGVASGWEGQVGGVIAGRMVGTRRWRIGDCRGGGRRLVGGVTAAGGEPG